MLRLLFSILFATLTVFGTFIALRLPFVAKGMPPLPDAEEIIRAGGVIFGSYRYSLQIPAVWLSGILLGPFWGLLSQAIFLLLGLFCLPIFLEGGGFGYLSQPTFGFLFAFLPAAWIVGKLRGQGGFKRTWFALATAQLFVDLVGSLGVALHEGFHPGLWWTAFHQSIQLLPGQLILITALAGFVVPFDFVVFLLKSKEAKENRENKENSRDRESREPIKG